MYKTITIQINEPIAEAIIKELGKSKALTVVSQSEPDLVYKPKTIEVNGLKYVFHKKLNTLVKLEENWFVITHKQTNIVAFGKNLKAAIENFNHYFHSLYTSYVHESVDNLTQDGLILKHTLSNLIKEVNEA